MKAFKFFFIPVIFTLLTFPLNAQENGSINTWKKEVIDIENQWVEAIQKKDVVKIMTFLADEAVMMSPGVPTLKGKDAIKEAVVAAFGNEDRDSQSYKFELEAVDVSSSGDLAVVRYSYKIVNAGQPVEGKGLDIFKKINGEWKCTAVIDNNTSKKQAGLQPPPPPDKK